ncbi:hypothetical protein [Streptomyces sp. NPDC008121]|uniref:hypothetical protein n=1 Tax=Streptomyces sp. NPDC008121 TaxID=3364809 RepID=UPI0036E1EFB3
MSVRRRRAAVIAVLAGIAAGGMAGSAAAAERPPVPAAAVSSLPDPGPSASQAAQGMYSAITVNNYTGHDLKITKIEFKGPDGTDWSPSDAFTEEEEWKPQVGDSLTTGRTFGAIFYIWQPEIRITAADESGNTLEFGVKTTFGGAVFTSAHSDNFLVKFILDKSGPYTASVDIVKKNP